MAAEVCGVVEGGAVDSPLRWAFEGESLSTSEGEAVVEILRDIEIYAV